MGVLPSSFACNAALKSTRGRPRSCSATRWSAAIGAAPAVPSLRRAAGPGVSSAWIARSSCSLRFGLGIGGTRPIFLLRRFAGALLAGNLCSFRAQSLYPAELQLFYRAFSASQGLRDFTDAFFFGESHLQDLALFDGQFQHPSE